MTEPMYVYKKGEGWVFQTNRQATGVIGRYLVTVTECEAVDGDSFFHEALSSSVEDTLQALTKYWDYAFRRGDPKIELPLYRTGTLTPSNRKTVVVTWTPL